MSKSHATPVSLLTLLLMLVVLTTVSTGPAAAKDAEQVAGEYVSLVHRVAQVTSGDSTQVVENASAMLEELVDKLREHEDAYDSIDSIPEGVVLARDRTKDNRRLVRKDDIIEIMFELGTAGENLSLAKAWGELTVREEVVKLSKARLQVKAQNQAEVARVYYEVQSRIQDRELAAMQLWALASGQAYVRVTETYSSGAGTSSRGRAATPLETQQFVGDLNARAFAPIQVDPARFIRVKDIHTIDQLRVNKKCFLAVATLKVRIDGELERLKEVHAQACQEALASKDEAERRHAMLSLGWWNGREERTAVEAALEHKTESIKDAAFAALHRLRPSKDALTRLAKRESMDIRREAAILAGECVGDTDGALKVARDLTLDPKPEVRQAAYASLNSLLAITNSAPLRALSFAETALSSQDPDVRLEAIRWVSSLESSSDSDFANRKYELLAPLASHKNKNEAVRAAASDANR